MERLTPKDWKEQYKPYHENGGYFHEEFMNSQTDDMILRLAELEDKLESGELVELPCKVGDTVYFVYSRDQRMPFPIVVQKMGLKIIDGELKIFVYDENEMGGRYGDFRNWYIGKDKATAEARLKELQEQKK